ncbi:daptide-type RiPP biosynthesis dehydogenase [Microbacterium sp. BLY]|uniref:daptide-type RiPP biosynthesis dehydogenase n=1 Tax=Microbacterium sp. BLY TaxID=2823280 RepID=UPI001B345144|nr:daptide-type RiPP biosynthesis dehydogenase [Microbacterium sp. BLY]MBP3976140.1 iron-containing alcohol dehydrogenase [Microbacterium sp. BLY]
MTARFTARVPTLWHGADATATTRGLVAGRDALVVADAAVASPLADGPSSRTMRLAAPAVNEIGVMLIAEQLVRRRPDVIVAVGGGSIIDASKIAALALGPGRLFEYALGNAATSGLTVLPDTPPPVDIVAVPTTLGTSSETNSVAILRHQGGHRLLLGRALRPRHAVLDPAQFATLRPAAVREGALEALLRLAGASTGLRRSARADHDARALGRALLETVDRGAPSPAQRLRLARLGAATQRTAALRGPDPYSARHWYLANEVAFHLSVRKMAATAAVIAAVWRRIGGGDARLGDRERLQHFWTSVVEPTTLPRDPALGITALVDRWGIPTPPRPSAAQIAGIAAAAVASWGGHRPMLHGLGEEDIRAVLRDSRWSAPATSDAKEVM